MGTIRSKTHPPASPPPQFNVSVERVPARQVPWHVSFSSAGILPAQDVIWDRDRTSASLWYGGGTRKISRRVSVDEALTLLNKLYRHKLVHGNLRVENLRVSTVGGEIFATNTSNLYQAGGHLAFPFHWGDYYTLLTDIGFDCKPLLWYAKMQMISASYMPRRILDVYFDNKEYAGFNWFNYLPEQFGRESEEEEEEGKSPTSSWRFPYVAIHSPHAFDLIAFTRHLLRPRDLEAAIC